MQMGNSEAGMLRQNGRKVLWRVLLVGFALVLIGTINACSVLGAVTVDNLDGEWLAVYTAGTMQSSTQIQERLVLHADGMYTHTAVITDSLKSASNYTTSGRWDLRSGADTGTILVLHGMHYFVNGSDFAYNSGSDWQVYAPDSNLGYIFPGYVGNYRYTYPDDGFVILFPAVSPSSIKRVLLHGSMGGDPDSRGLPKEFMKVIKAHSRSKWATD